MEQGEYFQLLKERFHQAPITQHVKQTMTLIEEGRVQIELHPNSSLHHGGGQVHGGIIGVLLDNAGYFAAATLSGQKWVATAQYNVNLLKPVGLTTLVGTGVVVKAGRNMIHTEIKAEVAGELVASALATYAVLPRRFA